MGSTAIAENQDVQQTVGKVTDAILKEHFAELGFYFKITLLEDTPEFRNIHQLISHLDLAEADHCKIVTNGNQEMPYYAHEARSKLISEQLIGQKGILPLLMKQDHLAGGNGRKIVLGLRPHQLVSGLSSSDEGLVRNEKIYQHLREPSELLDDLLINVIPNLHHYLNYPSPFTAEDVSFVLLPNDGFDTINTMLRTPAARQSYLGIIDEHFPTQVVFREIMRQVYETGASDIHLEPVGTVQTGSDFAMRYRVRLRIGTDLVELNNETGDRPIILNQEAYKKLISFINVLADAKSKETDPLAFFDGKVHFTHDLNYSSDPSDLEFSKIPREGPDVYPEYLRGFILRINRISTAKGPSVVARVAPPSHDLPSIHTLGMSEHQASVVEKAITETSGLIVTAGPTGSGKTTTQIACLLKLDSPTHKIITIEDPVEVMLPGIDQISINEERGLTAEVALASALRRDPNTVLIGEVRSEKTMDLVIKAAETGHIAFTTVHTTDAIGILKRFSGLGAEQDMVGSLAQLFISQRLVAQYNHTMVDGEFTLWEPAFKMKDVAPDLNELMNGEYITHPVEVIVPDEEALLNAPEGYSPFHRRMPIVELLSFDAEMRGMIEDGVHKTLIRRHAREQAFNPFVDIELDGLVKVLAGRTNLESLFGAKGLSKARFRDEELRGPIIELARMHQAGEEIPDNVGEALRGYWKYD